MEQVSSLAPSTLSRGTALPSGKPQTQTLGDMSVFRKTHWDLQGMWSIWGLEVCIKSLCLRSFLMFNV